MSFLFIFCLFFVCLFFCFEKRASFACLPFIKVPLCHLWNQINSPNLFGGFIVWGSTHVCIVTPVSVPRLNPPGRKQTRKIIPRWEMDEVFYLGKNHIFHFLSAEIPGYHFNILSSPETFGIGLSFPRFQHVIFKNIELLS